MDIDNISQILRTVLLVFSYISVLLLVGLYLRTKFIILQKLFLPASVIGGSIGLLLGQNVLKQYSIIPISEEWLDIASLLPGFLIVPVVASIPLGINYKMNKSSKDKNDSHILNNAVLIMLVIFLIISSVLMIFSLTISSLFKYQFHYEKIYPTFGSEIVAGYIGGHGTAGIVAGLLQKMEQPYWHIAQGVTSTTATVGLFSGIIIGIILINVLARKKILKFIHVNNSLVIQTGLHRDINRQSNADTEPSNKLPIDSLSLHLAIIFFVCGIAYLVTNIFEKFNIPLLRFIPEWTFAIIIMFIVWGLMQQLKLDWLIDVKTKTKIATSITEFAVVAAIISLPVEAVFVYAFPLVIMLAGGIVIIILLTYILSKNFFTDYWAERCIVIFGACTGVFITGILLLRMVDPEMKSSVMQDFSLTYSIQSLISFIIFPFTFIILIQYGYLLGMAFFLIIVLILIIILKSISNTVRKF